jgi:hypothetical protein
LLSFSLLFLSSLIVFSGGGGAAVVKFLKKSKKRDKIRSLSSVSSITITKQISQMGCHVSEKQQQFKIPNNVSF